VPLITNRERGQQPERRENFHHEGRKDHEEKIRNSNFEMSPLRVRRVLRGEEYFAQALKTFNYVNRNIPNSTQKFVGCARRTDSLFLAQEASFFGDTTGGLIDKY
jgi:hypothetical protein